MTKQGLRSYRELVVWQKAIDLVTDVYSMTKDFPRDETYGWTSQMRRSGVSVPSNVAEGQGRATKGEFIQSLCHARGSLFEFETQIVIAGKLGYITPEVERNVASKATEVARILNGLLTSLEIARRKTNHCLLAPLALRDQQNPHNTCRHQVRHRAGNHGAKAQLSQIMPPVRGERAQAANLNTDRAEVGESAERKGRDGD